MVRDSLELFDQEGSEDASEPSGDHAGCGSEDASRDSNETAGYVCDRRGQYEFGRLATGESVCIWPGRHPIEECHARAGECGIDGRGLTLRVLWMMSEARRQQARIALLPHLAGKFDYDHFIKTGACISHEGEPLPDTPTMRAAREEWERDQAIIAERMKNG